MSNDKRTKRPVHPVKLNLSDEVAALGKEDIASAFAMHTERRIEVMPGLWGTTLEHLETGRVLIICSTSDYSEAFMVFDHGGTVPVNGQKVH